METSLPPPNIVNSKQFLDQSKEFLDQSKNEKDNPQAMAPLESFDEFKVEINEKQKEEEEDGIFLFPRFGDFNDQQKSEGGDSQHKENGADGIQLSSRFGEFDGGFFPGSTTAQPFMKSGFGGRAYPDSMFSLPVNEARSEFGGINPESIPDVNIYQHKKTVAQGMMDLALFSANANQLRYVLESNDHPYFWPGVILIGFSLILQVVIGCGLLMNTRYNVKDKKEICVANRINNLTIVGIFLVTVINVFICAFGVASGAPAAAAVFIGPRSGEGFEAQNDTNSE